MAKYAYSNCGEMYYGRFNTKEEAALDGLCSGDEAIVYVGEVVPYTARDFVSADYLLQDMQERAHYVGGDWAEDWLVNLGLGTSKQLMEELEAAIGDIVDRYESPTFYTIKNVEEWSRADAISSGLYDPNA